MGLNVVAAYLLLKLGTYVHLCVRGCGGLCMVGQPRLVWCALRGAWVGEADEARQ